MTHFPQEKHSETTDSKRETRLPRSFFIDNAIAFSHFFLGMASILDFRGVLLNQPQETSSGFEKDIAALHDDWNVIGQDIYRAIDTFLDSEQSRDPQRE